MSDKKKQHRCMRCNETFDCEHGPLCEAKFDVRPMIARSVDGRITIEDHCPQSPDWNWIRAYGERMRAAGAAAS
jgi:hypothetical protein